MWSEPLECPKCGDEMMRIAGATFCCNCDVPKVKERKMNTEPMTSNELDMEKVEEMRKKGLGFKGVSKEEYEDYTLVKKYVLQIAKMWKAMEVETYEFAVKRMHSTGSSREYS